MPPSSPGPTISEFRRREAPRRTSSTPTSSSSSRGAQQDEVEILDLQEQTRGGDLEELVELLTDHGNGSFLRGWRCELDPSGILEVDIMKMGSVAKRLGWSGDVQSFLGSEENCSCAIGIEDVVPRQGQLLRRFIAWVKETFGTPMYMFEAFEKLEPAGDGAVSRERFVEGCRTHGFQASEQELGDVYDCCDWGEIGSIVKEDVIFLEEDRETRDFELCKVKTLNMREWRHQIAQEYLEQYRKPAMAAPQQKHRLAPRPWQAKTFEQLPTIACQQRNDRRRSTRRREQRAKEAFLHHLRESYGSEVRALRRSLDSDGSFGFTQPSLRHYCRKVDLDINPKDLWRALDRDGDGSVGLTELCMKPSLALARFQRWAVSSTLRSCADIWDTPEAVAARARTRRGAWGSEKKMLFASFAEALRDLDWPQVHDHSERSLVFSSLDIYGCGLIMRSDLEWLDKWKPPEWLHCHPDPQAWSNLKGLLVRIYRHPFQAWRKLLDRDDCGKVSWEDFKAACAKLRFRGKVAAIWRALDTDLVGFITVMDFDRRSALLLGSFKEWAESNYGSVGQCFRHLEDSSGLVCLSALKRACHKTSWNGDVPGVFDCLETENLRKNSIGQKPQRAVSYTEASFLDAWEFAPRDDLFISDLQEAGSESSSPRGAYHGTSSEATSTVPGTPTALPRGPYASAQTGSSSAESTDSGAEAFLKRSVTCSPKLFPLIPKSRQRGAGFESACQLGGVPDQKKKAARGLTRSVTQPGGLDALRTNTYPRQPRRPSLLEAACFEEEF